jgi:hypothetical protein
MRENDCNAVRPLLPRIADGEASPAEAMLCARHLSDCTACRILMARERRLAAILEEELEDCLLVGEDFVRDVMANLPKEPPPRPKAKKARRNLRLAGYVGLLFGLSALVVRGMELATSHIPTLALPRLETTGSDGGFESLLDLSRLLLVVAEFIGRHLPAVELSPIGLGGLLAATLFATAACGVGGTTLIALASHRISRLIG